MSANLSSFEGGIHYEEHDTDSQNGLLFSFGKLSSHIVRESMLREQWHAEGRERLKHIHLAEAKAIIFCLNYSAERSSFSPSFLRRFIVETVLRVCLNLLLLMPAAATAFI